MKNKVDKFQRGFLLGFMVTITITSLVWAYSIGKISRNYEEKIEMIKNDCGYK